jgi:hypothetical protein
MSKLVCFNACRHLHGENVLLNFHIVESLSFVLLLARVRSFVVSSCRVSRYRIIYSKQDLSLDHVQYFIYQVVLQFFRSFFFVSLLIRAEWPRLVTSTGARTLSFSIAYACLHVRV